MIDSLVSWFVIAFLAIVVGIKVFIVYVNAHSKPTEPTMEKDEDLIFF